MRWQNSFLIIMAATLAACSTVKKNSCNRPDTFTEFQNRAAKFHSVVTLPQFETTTNEIAATANTALATGNDTEFTSQINTVRAFDSKPAYTGQIPALDMLKAERQAQLFLYRRRLQDMYRFGQKAAEWATNPNFDSAFSKPGILFPIPNIERLANPCITNPSACK